MAITEAETRLVMVAARDFKEEEVLGSQMVKAMRMPRSALPPGIFSSFKDLEGRWAKSVILEGEPIAAKKLGPKGNPPRILAMPKEMRAYALEITEHPGALAPGSIKPGQRVDVVRYRGDEKCQGRGETILQDILLLAAGWLPSGDETTLHGRVVTCMVRHDQVASLVAAKAEGPLSLRLHSPEAAGGLEATGSSP